MYLVGLYVSLCSLVLVAIGFTAWVFTKYVLSANSLLGTLLHSFPLYIPLSSTSYLTFSPILYLLFVCPRLPRWHKEEEGKHVSMAGGIQKLLNYANHLGLEYGFGVRPLKLGLLWECACVGYAGGTRTAFTFVFELFSFYLVSFLFFFVSFFRDVCFPRFSVYFLSFFHKF